MDRQLARRVRRAAGTASRKTPDRGTPAIAPRWTDPRGIPAASPPLAARGSVRALGSRDGTTTLPGVAVATRRRSQAAPARPAAPPRPSAEMMLAPSIPAVPLIRLTTGSRPERPAPPPVAAVLICAALIAGAASFLIATLLVR